MGRVVTEATIENLEDLWAVKRGLLPPEQVRRIVVQDALVDTGAISLSLPTRYIQQLGLAPVKTRQTLTTGGGRQTAMYEAVRLTIQNRFCTVDVLEVPDEVPVLVGQIPIEFLDFVIDPKSRRLIGNPAHGGEQMFEMSRQPGPHRFAGTCASSAGRPAPERACGGGRVEAAEA